MFYIIPISSKSLYKLLDCVQRLIEISDDVIDMLGADRQADRVAADAYIGKLRIGELAVGRGGRVDYKALDIGDIGQQRKDLQMIDELEGLLLATLDVEGEDRRAAVGEVLLIQGVVGVIRQRGMVDLLDLGMVGQERDDLLGVLDVALDAQAQSLGALQQQECVERRNGAPVRCSPSSTHISPLPDCAPAHGRGPYPTARSR